MNIVMVTNTFTPHIGGVARSVEQFSHEYRRIGHRVLVVAPEFENLPGDERGVVRIPAVQHFNGSDFSVPMPIPGFLHAALDQFQPDIVHSHHPFLLGDTALRISASRDMPIVFTHHTQYEKYTHYVPGDSAALKQFVVELVTGYCNLCDAVIVPSKTIQRRLSDRGVAVETVEIPTGVDVDVFDKGDRLALRRRLGISLTDFVIGHVGRLAPEKGLAFLGTAVAQFMATHPNTVFLVAGFGPSQDALRAAFESRGLGKRLILLGPVDRASLADVYAAMDVFAFASQSETQGMVLTEAMAASTPVVAVDAPGVREVLDDGVNGWLLPLQSEASFVGALQEAYEMPHLQRQHLERGARMTASQFSMPRMARNALALYGRLSARGSRGPHGEDLWSIARRRFEEEWNIWSNVAGAAAHTLLKPPVKKRAPA